MTTPIDHPSPAGVSGRAHDGATPASAGSSALFISVVILTHNRPLEVVRAAASALAQSYEPLEVIVLDNGSEPSPEPELSAHLGHDPRLRLIRSDRNLGAAAGRNRAVERARGSCIVFLDDDAQFFDTEALARIARFFELRPDAGALQLSIVDPDGHPLYPDHGPWFDPADDSLTLTNYLVTAGCAVRRHVHERVGGFPEDLEVYYEDNYYALAIIGLGLALYHTREIRVEHPANAGRPRPARYYYLKARNVHALFAAHMPPGAALRYISRFQILHALEAARHRRLWPWLRGTIAGVILAARHLKVRPKLTAGAIAHLRALDRHRELLPELAARPTATGVVRPTS